jgi:AcrR family transcriptional regulator
MSAAERREQLLDATKALVDRHGFHAVSIEAVAREAGITRPIVYSHFHDLPGLLEALVEREGDRALAQLAVFTPADVGEGDAREVLLAAMAAYVETAESDPVTWKLVLMPPEGAPELLRQRIAEGRAAIVAQLAKAVQPLLAPGGGVADPELTALMLSTLADQVVRLRLTQPERYGQERLLEQTRWFLERLF